MRQAADELWSVATGAPYVDAEALAAAVESAASSTEPLDYRTRLLIRDSLVALESHWGQDRFTNWLDHSVSRSEIRQVTQRESFDADPDEIGFPSLKRRVMDATRPDRVLAFFQELSTHVNQPTQLRVGGSLVLILRGMLSRHTEDADVVNEVPLELRRQHEVLQQLADRYGIQLTHFQSHYLPDGWERRLKSLSRFGQLDVQLVDAYDVIASKLCSKRAKDLDDLRAMKTQLDRGALQARLRDSGQSLLGEAKLRVAVDTNWHILFGEPLPV